MTITIIEDHATQEDRAPSAAPPKDISREDLSRRAALVDPAAPTTTEAAGPYRAVLCCTYRPPTG
jgi:hypothetical protein